MASEAVSDVRHEYLAGVVYAMSGTTVTHGRIIHNIDRELGQQLRGRRCEAFTSEIKVRIRVGADEFYYYPDVLVDCGEPPGESLFAEEPRVIFEVLSPSTERTDRYEKRLNYQKLATLDVYVLVDQARVAVTAYRRADGDELDGRVPGRPAGRARTADGRLRAAAGHDLRAHAARPVNLVR